MSKTVMAIVGLIGLAGVAAFLVLDHPLKPAGAVPNASEPSLISASPPPFALVEEPMAIDGAPSFMQVFTDPLVPEQWFLADFVYESPVQRTGWEADHITFDDDGMTLKLTREPKEFQPYTGAEISRIRRYHYGRYEVIMKAAPGSGLVSSFFTHTDEFFGDPHNEIDFEFLGYDTEMVQLNFYSGNGNMNGHLVDLPFDAADHYQLYAFEWMPEQIDWYIGDERVFTATEASTGLRIPHRPSRLMMNLWSGSENQYNWHGEPTFESGSTSHYLCASYQAPGDLASPQCSDWFVADVPSLSSAAAGAN